MKKSMLLCLSILLAWGMWAKTTPGILWNISGTGALPTPLTTPVPDREGFRWIAELNAELTSTGQVRLSWAPLPRAASYRVYRADSPLSLNAGAWEVMDTLAASDTLYEFTPAGASGFYHVVGDDGFIFVEGGSFHNGISDVTVSSFYISRYEVTHESYQTVTGLDPGYYDGAADWPAEYMNWYKAVKYCNLRSLLDGLEPCYSYDTFGTNVGSWPPEWQMNHVLMACDWTADGYRLPTEMEWMYAAKGGNQTPPTGYPTYSGGNDPGLVAWYGANSGYVPHPVGTKAPNQLGTFDMSGNAFEWIWDIYGDYPAGPQTDPRGPASGTNRVMRGGSFFSYTAPYIAVTYRNSDVPGAGTSYRGFRVCRKAD